MKELSPRYARTFDEICSLQTDNHQLKNAWMSISEDTIYIAKQRNGEQSTGSVKITRAEFKRLIDWYNKPQKTRKKHAKNTQKELSKRQMVIK